MIKEYLYKRYNSNFGWVNFLSGILVSNAVNALTDFCSSDDSNIFFALSSVASFIASASVFYLYLKLSGISEYIEDDMQIETAATREEIKTRKKLVWREKIDENATIIGVQCFIAALFSVVGIGLLVLSYLRQIKLI